MDKLVHESNPAVFLNQAWSREVAVAGSMYQWHQVWFLALSRVRKNGHANFEVGEIARLLGMSPSTVSHKISEAVGHGWLDPTSGARCLVVPAHAIRGGLGNIHDKCVIHGRAPKVKPRRKLSPPTPTDSDSRTPAQAPACTSDTDRGPEGERVGGTCKVNHCDGTATENELCRPHHGLEEQIYKHAPDRETARRVMDQYVLQGDPRGTAIIDREATQNVG